MTEPIEFIAEVVKVQTLADGGLRLSFDLSETDIDVAAQIMKIKQAGAVLQIAAVAIIQSPTNGKTKTNQRTTRNPLEVD